MAERFVSALRFAPTSAIRMSGLWIAMGVRHTRAPRFAGELAQVMTKLDHAEAVVRKKPSCLRHGTANPIKVMCVSYPGGDSVVPVLTDSNQPYYPDERMRDSNLGDVGNSLTSTKLHIIR